MIKNKEVSVLLMFCRKTEIHETPSCFHVFSPKPVEGLSKYGHSSEPPSETDGQRNSFV